MDGQAPTLLVSDTDGAGPVQRRRPPLSCVECRRRKVKCDRMKPCGPCSRTRSPTCTYRQTPHGRRGGPEAHTYPPPGSVPSNQDTSLVTPTQREYTSHSQEFHALLNRYIAPGIFGTENSESGDHMPISEAHVDHSSDPTIQALVQKVRELEVRLGATSSPDSSAGTKLPQRPAPSSAVGQFIKNKYYGESHWFNSVEPYEILNQVQHVAPEPETNKPQVKKNSELYQTVAECKRLARLIKHSRSCPPPMPLDLGASIPPRDVCDELVNCYLRTFECVFRVVHIPTFREEYASYWQDPSAAKQPFLIKLILILAIGVPFLDNCTDASLLKDCVKWIQAAETYVTGPQEKSRVNLTGLQIHMLLVIARQMCRVDGDLIWIQGGTLLRTAMHLGLHRDPSHFAKLSPFHKEMRRRLWATTLELTVQMSLDMGMPPGLSLEDYDTLPPSNVNDEEIGDNIATSPDIHSATEFTQTSIQIALVKSLHLRLEITRQINNLRSGLTYDDTLKMSKELNAIHRSNIALFQGMYSFAGLSPSPFGAKMLDVLTKRFILCLHRPYYSKATSDPKFCYSRKICLETSLSLLAPPPALPLDVSHDSNADHDDWMTLSHNCVGFYKATFLYTVTTIYLEMLSQLEEQVPDNIPIAGQPYSFGNSAASSLILDSAAFHSNTPTLSPDSNKDGPSPSLAKDFSGPITPPPQFSGLRDVLVRYKDLTEERLRTGESNPKGNVFLACALARIDALVAGHSPEGDILAAARSSLATCAAIMRERYVAENGREAPGSEEFNRAVNGGDEVAGDVQGLGDLDFGAMESMDWTRLMQDDTLNLGFGGIGAGGGILFADWGTGNSGS